MTKAELEAKIQEARDAYYNGEAIISDAEYDALEDELLRIDPTNAILQGIGEDNVDGFPKAKHNILMGSQSKCNTVDQVAERLRSVVHNENVLFVVEDKCDGCLDYNTILETDIGHLAIGYIVENKVRCKVKAFDIDNNATIWTPITNWFINENNSEWYKLELDDGKEVIITGNHRVWLPKLNCWRKVEDLSENDEFLMQQM